MFYSMVGKYRAEVLHMLTTRKSFGNVCFFDQHYQPFKITSQVSVLMTEYLVVVSFELWMVQYVQYFSLFCDISYRCSRNRDTEKCYAYVVKGLIVLKGAIVS